jgi:hypothetical protein
MSGAHPARSAGTPEGSCEDGYGLRAPHLSTVKREWASMKLMASRHTITDACR